LPHRREVVLLPAGGVPAFGGVGARLRRGGLCGVGPCSVGVAGSGPAGWVFGLLRFTSEHPPLRPRPLPSVVGSTPVGVQEKTKDQ